MSQSSTEANGSICCNSSQENNRYNVEKEVLERYAAGAENVEQALCCPIQSYNKEFLKNLPDEIIEKDYGCGDPSAHVRPGEVALDLGSGQGKICYILSQVVGDQGQVIGVDFNDTMLNLARKYQDQMAEKLGYANTRFVKGKIQDLALDLDKTQAWLENNPIKSVDDMMAYEAECQRLRAEEPMIPDNSVDVVVSNCVLNLVRPEDKIELFREIFRVLKRGGRAVISDIVCDEAPTETIMNDPELWSGCISGAFLEDEFPQMFEAAGFYGIEILTRGEQPWQTIDGIEFREMTISATKGKDGLCMDLKQAVVYKGPFSAVLDDDNHEYERGKRMAVCEKTFNILMNEKGPYAGLFESVQPLVPVNPIEAPELCSSPGTLRHPRETKGLDYQATTDSSASCEDDNCCC